MKMEPSNEIHFQHAQSWMPKDLDHFDIFEEFPKINRFYNELIRHFTLNILTLSLIPRSGVFLLCC